MDREQLEMSFNGDVVLRPAIRRRRMTRARWWFDQMRQVVDRSWEWRPAPPTRPEQVYMPFSRARGRN